MSDLKTLLLSQSNLISFQEILLEENKDYNATKNRSLGHNVLSQKE